MPRNFIAFLFGNAVKGKEVKSKIKGAAKIFRRARSLSFKEFKILIGLAKLNIWFYFQSLSL